MEKVLQIVQELQSLLHNTDMGHVPMDTTEEVLLNEWGGLKCDSVRFNTVIHCTLHCLMYNVVISRFFFL